MEYPFFFQHMIIKYGSEVCTLEDTVRYIFSIIYHPCHTRITSVLKGDLHILNFHLQSYFWGYLDLKSSLIFWMLRD